MEEIMKLLLLKNCFFLKDSFIDIATMSGFVSICYA